MTDAADPLPALRAFRPTAKPRGVAPLGRGHIHRTWKIDLPDETLVLQQLNQAVFRDLDAVMHNIERVTRHLAAQGEETIELVFTPEGFPLHHDAQRQAWRIFRWVENSYTVHQEPSAQQAGEAARAFGRFQHGLQSLPSPDLQIPIPRFHHYPSRWQALEQTIADDVAGRVGRAADEIAFARDHQEWMRWLQGPIDRGDLPICPVHNDTKLNNVLFDSTDHRARCVVDLDTVMPGCRLHDYGDLVRTAAATAAEDDPELERVAVNREVVDAIRRGYLEVMGNHLTRGEQEQLDRAPVVVTFETGIRFLTDYLDGDGYFHTAYPDHNLVRCRNQFALSASLLNP